MYQTLSIALGQVKPGNTSGNSLNEIPWIIYSLHWQKETTKELYENIMISMKL